MEENGNCALTRLVYAVLELEDAFVVEVFRLSRFVCAAHRIIRLIAVRLAAICVVQVRAGGLPHNK